MAGIPNSDKDEVKLNTENNPKSYLDHASAVSSIAGFRLQYYFESQ
jgi:hypothetical protein